MRALTAPAYRQALRVTDVDGPTVGADVRGFAPGDEAFGRMRDGRIGGFADLGSQKTVGILTPVPETPSYEKSSS